MLSRRRPDSSFGLHTAKSCSELSRTGVEPRPVALAMAHGEIDLLACEIDMMQRRRNPQVDPRMRLGKMAEPMHQPFGGKIGRGADRQHAGVLPLQQPLGADRDAVERVADDGEIVAAGLGDDQALTLAVEQLDGQAPPPAP